MIIRENKISLPKETPSDFEVQNWVDEVVPHMVLVEYRYGMKEFSDFYDTRNHTIFSVALGTLLHVLGVIPEYVPDFKRGTSCLSYALLDRKYKKPVYDDDEISD